MNIPIPDPMPYRKKAFVPRTTKQIIYGRYSKEILPSLEIENPYYKPGYRRFKHFQFFTDEGIHLLREYIKDAVEIMADCTTHYEFMVKYSTKFKLAFQLSLFEEPTN